MDGDEVMGERGVPSLRAKTDDETAQRGVTKNVDLDAFIGDVSMVDGKVFALPRWRCCWQN